MIKFLAKLAEKYAKSTNTACAILWWGHQPKIPASLIKRTNKKRCYFLNIINSIQKIKSGLIITHFLFSIIYCKFLRKELIIFDVNKSEFFLFFTYFLTSHSPMPE